MLDVTLDGDVPIVFAIVNLDALQADVQDVVCENLTNTGVDA